LLIVSILGKTLQFVKFGCRNQLPKTIDELDLKFIKSLSENSRKTITQIAKEVGTSRPTAITRINSLAENNIIDFRAKINTAKLGFKLISVHFELQKEEESESILTKLLACPRLLQLFQEVGKNRFSAVMFAENAETMMSAVECLRTALNANITSWERIISLAGDSFSLKISLSKSEKTPCGRECGVCISFQQSECLGCPSTKDYKGPL
jgi:DNA-binding Lrp family transcriptional regulator